ncbi:hypothetical protein B1748_04860 [Paenibacillus sp. MY03]|uniref:hypothetical protein n=1 Tax=Paenibacillus sp. MY03 TaxID=302980 RepID=UPI000B3C54F2|nr:hypothetical protein [Paenibacillus sp. MY03]OUS78098.1 hypothetical protein B1748_04860 [Paenibacillus sp. MY03]
MLNTKRWTILSLTLALILLFITACSGNGQGNKPQNTGEATSKPETSASEQQADPFEPLAETATLNLVKKIRVGDTELGDVAGETLTQNRFTKQIEDELNVKLNWLWSQKDQAYIDKIKLMIASNDLPDIFYVDYATYLKLVKDGMIEEITEEYNNLASPELRETLGTDGGKMLEQLTIDGKLYGIGTMGNVDNAASVAWLRKDWIDELGLKEPSNVAELKTVVEAFNKHKGTTGIVGQEDSGMAENMFGFANLTYALGGRPFLWVKDDAGKLAYGSVQPSMKDALAGLRHMYAQGLLDKEFATTKNDQFGQKVASGKTGAFFSAWWAGWFPITDNLNADPKADWRAYAIKDEQGQYYGGQEPPAREIAVVRKGYEHPELLVKIWNYQRGFGKELDDPYADIKAEGKKGMTWNGWVLDQPLWKADLGVLMHKNLIKALDGKPVEELTGMDEEDVQNVLKLAEKINQNDPEVRGEAIARIHGMGALANEPNNNRLYNEFYGSTPTMEKRWVNLRKLELDAFLQIIIGNQPVDYFDEFVKKWMDQGGKMITDEVNEIMGS